MSSIKKRLKEHISLVEELKEIRERLEGIRCRAEGIKSSSRFDEVAAGGGNGTDKMAENVAAIIELEKVYQGKYERLTKEEIEIEKLIDGLESRERRIIRSRYIDGETFEMICCKMCYSWRHVHRLHGEALKKLEDMENENRVD